jgi:hypothetical protein
MPTTSAQVPVLARAVTASAHWTDETPRLLVCVQSPRGTFEVVAKGLIAARCGAIQPGDRLEIEGAWDPVHQRFSQPAHQPWAPASSRRGPGLGAPAQYTSRTSRVPRGAARSGESAV